MGAGTTTVDSNISGLAVAEEVLGTPKTLPGTPVWYPLEPNSYGEFGGQTKTTKREPISATRQKRKGVVTDFDVMAGFTVDFTTKAIYNLMQGFMFATWREKDVLAPTAVTGTAYTVASGGAAYKTGTILFAENFGVAVNNGMKVLTADGTGTTVTAPGVAAEASPPSTATITRVGFQGASGDLTVTVVNGLPQLNTTGLNFSTLGLIPGEWVFLGGDTLATQFATSTVNGWYRIKSVSATALVFDKFPGDVNFAAVADAGTGKTVQVFLGHAMKNETTQALQRFRTYQFERSLGGTKYQYELGCGANSLALNVKMNDKVTADLAFVGMDEDTTQVAAKSGTRLPVQAETAFNAASSFSRLRLVGQDGVTPLCAVLTDLKLSIDNGINGLSGITNSLGKVDLSSGDFAVSGNVTAYFSSLAAVAAVKANPDCSIDMVMADNVNGLGTGWLFDIPLLMVGDGRLKVEKDKPIMLPLNLDAAGHTTIGHTLMVMRFAYLPQLAL